jgi:hypothetical protein
MCRHEVQNAASSRSLILLRAGERIVRCECLS